MSDPIKLAETCWCGADVTVEGAEWGEARGYVASWRTTHQHRPGREVDAVGFAASAPAERQMATLNRAGPMAAEPKHPTAMFHPVDCPGCEPPGPSMVDFR